MSSLKKGKKYFDTNVKKILDFQDYFFSPLPTDIIITEHFGCFKKGQLIREYFIKDGKVFTKEGFLKKGMFKFLNEKL